MSKPVKLPGLSEAKWQEQVIGFAQLFGWKVAWFRKVRIQRKNGSVYYETPVGADGTGWPDLFLVRKNRAVAAELKVEKRKPTPEQRVWLDRLAAVGIEIYVWRPEDWAEVEEKLR